MPQSWRRVTREHPCPVCGKPDWCSLSADGTLAACRRVEAGCWRAKADRSGTPVYLHRLDGATPPDSLPPPTAGPAVGLADPDTRHRAYSALLARLQLSAAHREALRRRGLTDDEIDRRGYRSLPVRGRARLARDLCEHLSDPLLSVPGFVVRQGADGRPYVTLAGSAGLLVPVRDPGRRVVALLVRRDGAGDGRGKYQYLSSARDGGPGPGAPPHVPLGVTPPCHSCRLTEGALKADVAQALSGLPTVGAAGLAWRQALEVLRELGCRTVRLALDADAVDNAHVARALAAAAEGLAAAGLAVELERWDRASAKGIDDLLAAGHSPELLTGDGAVSAIREALAAATAGEPPPPPPVLERLRHALDAGGAEAVYRDAGLLRDLARLAEDDPGEYACCRAALARGGVRLRDLDAALAPHRQALRRDRPPPDVAGCYRVAGGRVVREVLTRDGPIEVPLANWSARIVEEVLRDDGAERQLLLVVEGALADGTPLSRVELAAEEYAGMGWPVVRWGSRAVVFAGQGTHDHLRAALQLLSGDVPRRTVYAHTGWRAIGGAWYYLHAGGAIGAGGSAAGVAVDLPGALAGYLLPAPPEGADLAAAIRGSLAVLDLAPDRITVPLLGAAYRAALGPADYSLHLAGPTGAGKTELAALAMQHWGAGLDARHLPGSWGSTALSLAELAHAAADALLVVDDYAPGGTPADVARLGREADRLLRAAGNLSGRGRLRPDGTLRPARPPRGTILSTGEDVPPGQSLRARLLVLELAPGDLRWDRLTDCQRDAAAGRFAQALAGYLRWLAARYAAVRDGLRTETAALRGRVHAEGLHARTPAVVADLAAGWRWWLDYALAAGAIDAAEREALARRAWAALIAASAEQAGHVAAAEPCGHYLRLLADALASGRAHVAGPGGDAPTDAAAWGWREVAIGAGQCQRAEWQPQGQRIGWVDGADLYLAPEAAYAAAQKLAGDQGEALAVRPRTLAKRLKDKGLLASWDAQRQRNTVRRTLEGGRHREVLHLPVGALSPCEGPSTPSTADGNANENLAPEAVSVGGAGGRFRVGVDGRAARPSTGNGHNLAETPLGGRCGRSDPGGEAGPQRNGDESVNPPGCGDAWEPPT